MSGPAINEAPPGWLEASLGELLREALRNGHSARASGTSDGVPTLTLSAVTQGDFSTKNIKYTVADPERVRDLWLQPGDILIERSNTPELVGTARLFSGPPSYAIFPDLIIRARLSTELSDEFVAYFLQTIRARRFFQRKAKGIAGSMPKIGQGTVEAIHIPVAPRPEQSRIVEALDSYLSRLDAAEEGLKRVEANLKRYRASVLKAAVEGRLVPTEAELARQEGRDYEPASVLLERILKERRRRWEEAELAKLEAKGKVPKNDKWKAKYKEPVGPDTNELPLLPERWCWASWGQVGFSQNGRAFPSKEYQERGTRLLRPGNLHQNGRVEWTRKNTRSMPERWAEDFPGHLIRSRELVMNLTAQSLKDEFLGRICRTGPGERCLLNQRIARLSPVVVNLDYVFWVFKSPIFRRFVDGLNTGSLIQHMFTSQLAEFVLPLAPMREQVRIARKIEEALSVEDHIERTLRESIARIDRLRQAILKWAFEGKLIDQDPNDEPAAILLDRIREESETAAQAGSRARRRAKQKTL